MASDSSVELRIKGNLAYADGCADSLAPVVRSGRLLKASKLYKQAFYASKSEDEQAKCSKNLGAVHWKHAKLCLEMLDDQGKGSLLQERPPAYDIEMSFEYYLAALRHGRASRQSAEWRANIKQNLEEMSRQVVEEYTWLLSKPEFVANINKRFQAQVSSAGKSQAWAIFQLGVAQHIFDSAVKELRLKDSSGSRNYRGCLSLLHTCYGPLGEAERRARPDFLEEISTLKASVESCRLTCESMQANTAGKRLLEESMSAKDRGSRHDMVTSALDKFKEAAVTARGVDAECEAEAMANVGDVYKEIFNKDTQAHPYYSVAVLLAQNSDAMLSAKWYEKAKVALNIFFKKKQEDNTSEEVHPQVRKEVEKLETEYKKLNTEEFLKYVYTEHPPRGSNGSHGPGELNTGASTRLALRKAIQHYHPDHNAAVDDPQWITLCGEITKLLLEKHRLYSNECRP